MTELTLQDLRRMGGEAVKKKYGSDHFKELNRKSQESKKRKKQAQSSLLTTAKPL